MSITRVGANQRYSSGWELAFGGKKKSASGSGTEAGSKKTSTKSAKPKTAKKKAAKKKK